MGVTVANGLSLHQRTSPFDALRDEALRGRRSPHDLVLHRFKRLKVLNRNARDVRARPSLYQEQWNRDAGKAPSPLSP
jgi:hypothetical protein